MTGTTAGAGTGVAPSREPSLVALVGLCPMLPGADSLVKGFGLAAVTLAVLATAGLAAGLMRRLPGPAARAPACLLVIAAAVVLADVLSRAYFFELRLALGAALSLVVANCAVLARTLALASPQAAPADAVQLGRDAVRLALVLVAVGALRELLGHGSVFDGAPDLFGESARRLVLRPFPGESSFSLAAVPAGAFFALAAVLVAWRIATASGRQR